MYRSGYSLASLWAGCPFPSVPEASAQIRFCDTSRGFPYSAAQVGSVERTAAPELDAEGANVAEILPPILERALRVAAHPVSLSLENSSGAGPTFATLGDPFSVSRERSQHISWAARVAPDDPAIRRWTKELPRIPAGEAGRTIIPEIVDATVATLLESFRELLGEEVQRASECSASESSLVLVRPPWKTMPMTGTNVTVDEVALILASSLEAIGAAPVLVGTGTSLLVGWKRSRVSSFRPLWRPEELQRHLQSRDVILVNPAEIEACGEDFQFALDVAAARPDLGKVAPMKLAREPIVAQALVWARRRAEKSGRMVTEDLLHGLLRSDSELIHDALLAAGADVEKVSPLRTDPSAEPLFIWDEDPRGSSSTPQNSSLGFWIQDIQMTRSCAASLEVMSTLAAEQGRTTVCEEDLAWSIVSSSSRATRQAIERLGVSIESLRVELARRSPAPAESRYE